VYMACLIDLCKNKSSSDPEANCVSCDQRMLGNIVVNATQDITSIITFDEGPVVLTDALASEFEEKRRVLMCRSCAAVHMAAFNFVIGGQAILRVRLNLHGTYHLSKQTLSIKCTSSIIVNCEGCVACTRKRSQQNNDLALTARTNVRSTILNCPRTIIKKYSFISFQEPTRATMLLFLMKKLLLFAR
jgi:hypothetical protein